MEKGRRGNWQVVFHSNVKGEIMAGEGLKTLPKMEAVIIEKKGERDLAIAGGGPAGLTAGIFAVRMGLNAILIEKALPGGLMGTTDRIENYPGFPKEIKGMELSAAFEAQARELGLNIVWGTVNAVEAKGRKKRIMYDEKTVEAKAIIIATGTEPKKLGVPGEKEFLGRGVSYCATCDGPFYKDKKVIVVGGGNAAIEEALFLTNFASTVTIIHRRGDVRADKIFELRARSNPKIFFLWNSELEKIEGADKVKSITVKNSKTGKKTTVSADGVFIYVGSTPNVSFLRGILKQDKDGFIITDEEMRTSAKGIFAAGDVRAKSLRQIVTATSDGATAADSAYKYLESLK